jgi:broad specificity phosphatase PhoE
LDLRAVRHGQSLTNAAGPAGVPGSDAEVPLTELGREQSRQLGRALADDPPDLVLSSIYVRARETTALALGELRAPVEVRYDERLRDRELGALEMMTQPAVAQRFPEEVARRALVGDFLYRPPAGESMADVALRMRGLLRDVTERYGDRRVLLVCHDSVVLILRYLLEDIPAEEVWGLGPVLNGAVTRWTGEPPRLVEFNAADHLRHS